MTHKQALLLLLACLALIVPQAAAADGEGAGEALAEIKRSDSAENALQYRKCLEFAKRCFDLRSNDRAFAQLRKAADSNDPAVLKKVLRLALEHQAPGLAATAARRGAARDKSDALFKLVARYADNLRGLRDRRAELLAKKAKIVGQMKKLEKTMRKSGSSRRYKTERVWRTCPRCKGRGQTSTVGKLRKYSNSKSLPKNVKKCTRCNGTGKIRVTRRVRQSSSSSRSKSLTSKQKRLEGYKADLKKLDLKLGVLLDREKRICTALLAGSKPPQSIYAYKRDKRKSRSRSKSKTDSAAEDDGEAKE